MNTIFQNGLPLAATVLVLSCADLALEADRIPASIDRATETQAEEGLA